jgi:uncharacterized membrane protein YfcA
VTAAITVAIGAGFLAMVAFIALYWRSDWRRTPVGRNLMALPAVLGALLGLWLVARVVGDLPMWVWLGGILSLDAVMWWRVWILWRLQHDERAGP